MKIEFNGNVIEQNLNIKGVKVRVIKQDANEYNVCIDISNCKYDLANVPESYDYLHNNFIRADKRYLNLDYNIKNFWCNGLWEIKHSGCIAEDILYTIDEVNIIIEAIINGINKLEELSKVPEIIKIGNVTIEKKKIDDNNVSLTIQGLSQPCDYPYNLWHNSNILAWTPDNEVFDLWDEDHEVVWINNKQYFPLKDFKVSNEDAEKVIKIITVSEEKLARWKLEQEEIKVGDYVKPKDYITSYKYKIIAIYNDEYWVQMIGKNSNSTGIFKKDSFIKCDDKL